MPFLLNLSASKRNYLCVLFAFLLVGVENASARGWVVNPSAKEKAVNSGDSLSTVNTSAGSNRAIDRGVLVAKNDTKSGYRSSGYKSDGVMPDFAAPISAGEAISDSTSALNSDPMPTESLEASRSLGKGVIYPIAQLSLGYRDDIYESNESGVDKVSGAATLGWQVGGGYQGSYRDHLNGVEYLMEGTEFLSGDNDENEVSQRINGYWGTAFTPRNHLDLGIEYVAAYDPRGKGDARRNIRFNTTTQDPDRWNELTGGGIYSFGRNTARGRLELSAYLANREYENNGQQFRNRDELDLGAAAYFKIMAKTEFYAQVVYTDYDYVNQAAEDPTNGRDLDNEETRYMLGIKWYPSDALSGTLRVGTAEKTFDASSQRQNYEEFTWDSNLLWIPSTRNQFGLSYSRAPRESFVYTSEQLLDDLIEIENLALSWSHAWGQRLSTTLSYTLGKDRYLPSGRVDDRDEFSIGFQYALPRLGSLGLTYFKRKLVSNIADQSYDDDGISIYFNIGSALGLGDGNSRAPGIRNQRQYQPGYAVY